MKNLLIALLVIAMLGASVVVVGGIWAYRAASPLLEDAREYVAALSSLDDLRKEIRNTAAYAPPLSGELTAAQVQRFARVQERVRTALGRRVDEIERKYEHLSHDGPGHDLAVGEVMRALGEMASVFVEARRYHVNALNEEKFSEDEYAWVRDRVFQAAGVEVGSRIDLREIEDALRGAGLDRFEAPELPKIDIPERNRTLVKPYLDQARLWLPLAFFGL